jgi:hypothetical protein
MFPSCQSTRSSCPDVKSTKQEAKSHYNSSASAFERARRLGCLDVNRTNLRKTSLVIEDIYCGS